MDWKKITLKGDLPLSYASDIRRWIKRTLFVHSSGGRVHGNLALPLSTPCHSTTNQTWFFSRTTTAHFILEWAFIALVRASTWSDRKLDIVSRLCLYACGNSEELDKRRAFRLSEPSCFTELWTNISQELIFSPLFCNWLIHVVFLWNDPFSTLQEEHKSTERRAIVLENTVSKSPRHQDVYSANSQQVCRLRLKCGAIVMSVLRTKWMLS